MLYVMCLLLHLLCNTNKMGEWWVCWFSIGNSTNKVTCHKRAGLGFSARPLAINHTTNCPAALWIYMKGKVNVVDESIVLISCKPDLALCEKENCRKKIEESSL